MFIADAHCDTLYDIAIHGMKPEDCAITRPRLEAGGVGLQTFALFAGRKGPQGTPYADGLAMLDVADQVDVEILTGRLPAQKLRRRWIETSRRYWIRSMMTSTATPVCIAAVRTAGKSRCGRHISIPAGFS